MIVCPECHGGLYLKNNNDDLEVGRGSGAFTAPTVGVAVRVCPTCLGAGYSKGAGT